MPRTDNEVRIVPSVLDRLIDYEPELSREPPASRSKSLRLLKQSVKRDLECMLNTRQSIVYVEPEMKELTNSLACYGLPDFSNASVKSKSDQNRLRRALEAAIATFEPRLEDVKVSLEATGGVERILHFRIDARLRVDPAPEPVTFDTRLHVTSGEYTVQEE